MTEHFDYYINGNDAAIIQEEISLQVIDWQLIVKEHGPRVWQTAYRLLSNHTDAADCFQETFVCALAVSRHQRIRSFSALLVRLATARAIDMLRQRLRRSKLNIDAADLAAVPGHNPGPVQEAQGRELAERLRAALGQLPSQEAQVFCLRYLNGFSYSKIGKELGIKANAAGVLLHRARAKLRQLLGFSPAAAEQ